MATADYDFIPTRNELIKRAFRIIGKLGDGQELSGEQAVNGSIALNTLIKHWESKDIHLWRLNEESISFSADESSKALDNSIMGIEQAWYEQSGTNVPLDVINYREYLKGLSTTSSSDYPNLVSLGYEKTVPTLYIWPKSSGSLTVKILAIKNFEDMDSASDTPDVPQRYIQALVYALAVQLSNEYTIPLEDRRYIKNLSDEYFLEANQSDYEYEDITIMASSYKEK